MWNCKTLKIQRTFQNWCKILELQKSFVTHKWGKMYMFQNSFIWKKNLEKRHTIMFYNNPIGSLYPICTQLLFKNFFWKFRIHWIHFKCFNNNIKNIHCCINILNTFNIDWILKNKASKTKLLFPLLGYVLFMFGPQFDKMLIYFLLILVHLSSF
jgi:hypothetical protein